MHEPVFYRGGDIGYYSDETKWYPIAIIDILCDEYGYNEAAVALMAGVEIIARCYQEGANPHQAAERINLLL